MTIFDDHLEDVRDLIDQRKRDGQAFVTTNHLEVELGIDPRVGGRLLARLAEDDVIERWSGGSCSSWEIKVEPRQVVSADD